MRAFFEAQGKYGSLFRRTDWAVVGAAMMVLAALLRWSYFGYAATMSGLLMEIGAAFTLATGVLKLELQPVGTQFRFQTAWQCKYWGFKTEDERRLAVARKIQSGGRLLFWGFVLQMVGISHIQFIA